MTQTERKDSSIYQLRIYEVSPEKRIPFHKRFKENALRIMKRYEFEPVALWESKSVLNFEFIYILRWPDLETMDRQWKLFLADPEWIEIKRKMAEEIGEPVQSVTSRLLDAVEYSPVFNF